MPFPLVSDPEHAISLLAGGGVALLPVDTVPGLAARADHPLALGALAILKGRPAGKPFALAFRDLAQLLEWLPAARSLRNLLERLLPGPLTAVLPGSPALGAHQADWALSVGARIPGPCPCSSLLERLPWPLALSSANRSGEAPLGPGADPPAGWEAGLAFRWPGASPLGRESTVLDLRCHPPHVLRQGALSAAELTARLEGMRQEFGS